MNDAAKESRLALMAMIVGGLAGVPAFFAEGSISAVFLLPVGVGFSLSGFLVAIDYRGSVDLYMRVFWFNRKIPPITGRWQARVIGVVMCIVGTGLAIGGCIALLDAVGVIDHQIEG